MIYYISDTHFFHAKIIELCNRPYDSVEEMNEDIVKKWNNKVTNNDDVYFLGDFALKGNTYEIINIMKRLKGKIHFIQGNHDDVNLLKELKRQNLIEDFAMYREIEDNGRKVVLFHYPIEDWNGQYKGSYHIFGHIHNNNLNEYRVIPNRFNAGVEVIGYEPKTLDGLIKLNSLKQTKLEDFVK